ncbi:MAG: hypothetical protein JSR46_02220 [Verrucomicrobia bacterium]|nr:hypothetical protein [Verrucomicrobiota bacterium]
MDPTGDVQNRGESQQINQPARKRRMAIGEKSKPLRDITNKPLELGSGTVQGVENKVQRKRKVAEGESSLRERVQKNLISGDKTDTVMNKTLHEENSSLMEQLDKLEDEKELLEQDQDEQFDELYRDYPLIPEDKLTRILLSVHNQENVRKFCDLWGSIKQENKYHFFELLQSSDPAQQKELLITIGELRTQGQFYKKFNEFLAAPRDTKTILVDTHKPSLPSIEPLPEPLAEIEPAVVEEVPVENKVPTFRDKIAEALHKDPVSILLPVLEGMVEKIPKKSLLGYEYESAEVELMNGFIEKIKNNSDLKKEINQFAAKALDKIPPEDKEQIIDFLSSLETIDQKTLIPFLIKLLPLVPTDKIDLGQKIKIDLQVTTIECRAIDLLFPKSISLAASGLKTAVALKAINIKEKLDELSQPDKITGKAKLPIPPKMREFISENFKDFITLNEYIITTLLEEPEIKPQIKELSKQYENEKLKVLRKEEQEIIVELKQKIQSYDKRIVESDRMADELNELIQAQASEKNPQTLEQLGKTIAEKMEPFEDFQYVVKKARDDLEATRSKFKEKNKEIKDADGAVVKSFLTNIINTLSKEKKEAIGSGIQNFVRSVVCNYQFINMCFYAAHKTSILFKILY